MTLPDFFKIISPNSEIIDYLKRYFYQIIGIYFPSTILAFYIFLFWYIGPNNDPITYYSIFSATDNNGNFADGWPKIIADNIYKISTYGQHIDILEVILFVVIVVILGEGINAVTSKFTLLSPVTTTLKEKIDFSLRNMSFPGMSKISNWPVWLNETSFPVSFAEFDRYYISALEQDKRTLAGKIGWLSFYRNMSAVFIVILILQMLLIVTSSIKYCDCLDISLPKIHGYEIYVIIISSLATILFLLGLQAQEKSSRETLWDAYKRYQLRKNLEIRHGDISLAFGIADDHKKRALEYIIDRWFLGVDNTIQTISRHLLTKLEERYREINQDDKGSSYSQNKKFKKIIELLTDSYRYWNRGGYENVISTTITALKEIEKLTKDTEKLKSTKEKKEILPSEDDWKFILGFYILENSLRTDAAFAEIYKTVRNRGWTEEKNEKEKETLMDFFPKDANGETKEKPNENEKLRNYYNANYKLDKQYHDNLANLIREVIDPYQRAFYQIMFTMEEYCSVELSDTNKKEGFYKLREIYRLFGGFEYDSAFEEAKKLLDWLNEIKQSN